MDAELQPEMWLPLTCTFAQPSPRALSKVQSPPYPCAAQGQDQGRKKQSSEGISQAAGQRLGEVVGTGAEAPQDRNLMQKRAASVSQVSAAHHYNLGGGEREA